MTAEVFASAVRSIEKYSGNRPLLAWLYGIARHRVADHFRRARPRESLFARVSSGITGVTRDEEWRHTIEALGSSAGDPGTRASLMDLGPALGRLTPDQREVLVLRFLVGLTTPEIATAMGKGATAIYSLEARALSRLRKDLG